jgi:hypothetical protein
MSLYGTEWRERGYGLVRMDMFIRRGGLQVESPFYVERPTE